MAFHLSIPRVTRSVLAGAALTASTASVGHSLALPEAVLCLMQGEVQAFDDWHRGAPTLVAISRGPGRVDFTSHDGAYTQWGYGGFNGLEVRVCETELDVTADMGRCLEVSGTPRQFEEGLRVRGEVGSIWRGELRCELPIRGGR